MRVGGDVSDRMFDTRSAVAIWKTPPDLHEPLRFHDLQDSARLVGSSAYLISLPAE